MFGLDASGVECLPVAQGARVRVLAISGSGDPHDIDIPTGQIAGVVTAGHPSSEPLTDSDFVDYTPLTPDQRRALKVTVDYMREKAKSLPEKEYMVAQYLNLYADRIQAADVRFAEKPPRPPF